jgi:hypothetical protein
VVANLTGRAIAVGGGWHALLITGDLTFVFMAVALGLTAFSFVIAVALATRAVLPRASLPGTTAHPAVQLIARDAATTVFQRF